MNIKKYGIVYILAGFAILSLIGIFYNYSIPNTIGDETVLMSATLKMLSEQTLRPAYPTNYHMPFGTYMYLPIFVITLIFLRFFGPFTSISELKTFGILEYGKLLPIARFVSVFLGVWSVYLVYRICRKLFNNTFISLLASFLLATNIMFLYLAHFGKVWMPQIFVILLTFDFIVDLYKKKTPKFLDYFKPAFMTGISFGTHFIGILVYLPFLAAHYLKHKGRGFFETFIKNKNFWLSNCIILLTVLLVLYLNPYGFSNYVGHSLFHTVSLVSVASDAPEEGIDIWQGITVYWSVLFEYGFALTLIFLSALIPFFRHRRDLFWIFVSFIFGYYFVIGPLITSSKIPHPHYVSSLIPFMSIIAAYGVYYFYYDYQNNFFTKKIKFVLLAILLTSSLYLPIMWDYSATKPSTYLLAREWVYSNVPTGAKIISFRTDLPFNENKESISDIKKHSPASFTKKREYLLSYDDTSYPWPNYYILTPGLYLDGVPAEVSGQKFDYAIIGWHTGGYEEAISEAAPYGVKEENLVQIFPEGMTRDSFSMDLENIRNPLFNLRKITHIGPIIVIYKLD